MGAAAPYSEEAVQQVNDLLEQLRGIDDESLEHLLDPDAQTDWELLRKTPGFQRVKRTEGDENDGR